MYSCTLSLSHSIYLSVILTSQGADKRKVISLLICYHSGLSMISTFLVPSGEGKSDDFARPGFGLVSCSIFSFFQSSWACRVSIVTEGLVGFFLKLRWCFLFFWWGSVLGWGIFILWDYSGVWCATFLMTNIHSPVNFGTKHTHSAGLSRVAVRKKSLPLCQHQLVKVTGQMCIFLLVEMVHSTNW